MYIGWKIDPKSDRNLRKQRDSDQQQAKSQGGNN
jgi:hypothetical protein